MATCKPDNAAAYSSSQLAALFDLHPNTIRLYEKWGLITPARRQANGYRSFGRLQELQLQVCRRIFGYPFFNKPIRKAGYEAIRAAAAKDWSKGRSCTQDYIRLIRQELELARRTADILLVWANPAEPAVSPAARDPLSRKQAAALLGITVETVRNWEKNGLIHASCSGSMGERQYAGDMQDRLRVVYMLRQAGYSVAAIHHSLSVYDEGQQDVHSVLAALNNPRDQDIVSAGDRWLFELDRVLEAADDIPAIFDQMETLTEE